MSLDPVPPRDRAALLRILDANLNRASEGLRVVEEYCRFVLEDANLAERCKHLRHDLASAFRELPARDLLASRDTPHDVGVTLVSRTEYVRTDIYDVVQANLKRVEQALRVMEEYGKVLSQELGGKIERLRYTAYELASAVSFATVRTPLLAEARLYVLIDGNISETLFERQVEQIVAAGAHAVQLRMKGRGDAETVSRARLLRRATRNRCLFIMNDRADLAAIADADGVHLGQDDIQVRHARRILGPRALIGVSTHDIDQARQAVRDGADYLGCGPTFPSGTKHFDAFPGLDFLRQVAAEISLPAFAIGGITLDNLDEVLATGIRRVAVSGAIAQASVPAVAVKAFLELLNPAH